MKNIVFFSGGSALAAIARELARRMQSPVYLLTTFDSGGSTQALRKTFGLPAVGDLRNRLLACVASEATLQPVVKLLKTRISKNGTQKAASEALRKLITACDFESMTAGPEIRLDLEEFMGAMPQTFDARNASIGNLALAGAWLRSGRQITAALERYAKLLQVSAQLVPIVVESLHLGLEMVDGSIQVGQHRLNQPLPCRVKRIFLTSSTPWQTEPPQEERPVLAEAARAALEQADIICFPMGSFYSSILSNLLPQGVGRAIAASRAKKVFIPNTGMDPEVQGLDIAGQAQTLIDTLQADAPYASAHSLIDIVLADATNGDYPGSFGNAMRNKLRQMDLYPLDAPIVCGPGHHDPVELLAQLERLL